MLPQRGPLLLCFSPLFIGKPTASRGSDYGVVGVPQFQSPIHRETHCKRNRRVYRRRTDTKFQSPIHRETHCKGKRNPSVKLAKRCFSPLFIGKPTASFPPPAAGGDQAFQSPIHRETHCKLKERAERVAAQLAVSVPYSSGNPLQAHPCSSLPVPNRGFSPLFIGKPTARALARSRKAASRLRLRDRPSRQMMIFFRKSIFCTKPPGICETRLCNCQVSHGNIRRLGRNSCFPTPSLLNTPPLPGLLP